VKGQRLEGNAGDNFDMSAGWFNSWFALFQNQLSIYCMGYRYYYIVDSLIAVLPLSYPQSEILLFFPPFMQTFASSPSLPNEMQ
jgi:hypothetical protein